MSKVTVKLEEDENGELIIPLCDDLVNELDWQVGDEVLWIDNGDGTYSIAKVVEDELLN